MKDFTSILNDIIVASSTQSVTSTHSYQNISGAEFLENIKKISVGKKDGANFIRAGLNTNDDGTCLPRADCNAQSLASILIVDCDRRIDTNGEEIDGAPAPDIISEILRKNNIAYVIYGTHSHYVGDKGNRYRIVLFTKTLYTKAQIAPTVESIVVLINSHLNVELLANAKENGVWAQSWYYARKPENSVIANLYFEYLDGNAIDVIDASEIPLQTKTQRIMNNSREGEISPIDTFNQQHLITDLLIKYGYKLCCRSSEYEKWLSPNSTSGQPGITIKNNKMFSHHNDELNDGWWHDAFDLMRVSEKLNEKEAVIHASQITLAPDGRTVDEHNKKLTTTHSGNACKTSVTLHSVILNQLLEKIQKVNFKKIANLDDDKEPKQSHYHVIAIETVLETAKKESLGLCRNHDFIYLYNGAYWNLIDRDELKTFLGKAAEKMSISHLLARHHKFKEELYRQFLTSAHLPKPEQPKDTVLINLKNGTFEITPTGNRLKTFDPNDFLTYQLPFDYDPEAKAPQFEKYIDKVLPDKLLQKILSEYLGYIFIKTGVLKLEKTLLLYGGGANGKSVFYEIVRSLLGEQNTSEYSLQSLTNENGYERAMIANKLVNYASEINGKLQSNNFKLLVSGEPIGARLPYGNPFIMTDYAKLMFNCNELPTDVELSEAYFRRFIIIPFNVTIPENEQDKQLAKKIIESELSGVFNWVLEGLKRLLLNKQFTESDTVKQMRTQYEKDSDSVALFLEDGGYKPNLDSWICLKALFNKYRSFCTEYGYKSVNHKNFKKRFARAKIHVEKKNCGLVAFVDTVATNEVNNGV